MQQRQLTQYPWVKFVLAPGTIVPHRAPGPLARRFQQICVTYLAEIFAAEKIPGLEYAALACIDDFPGIDQNSLATLVGIDRTSASQKAERLETQGFIVRHVNGDDRRAKLLHLTREGRAKRQRLLPKLLAAQDRMLAPLSPKERALLMDLLTRVIEANEIHARPGAGRRPPRKRPPANAERDSRDESGITARIGRRVRKP